jgi:hypothetical protein
MQLSACHYAVAAAMRNFTIVSNILQLDNSPPAQHFFHHPLFRECQTNLPEEPSLTPFNYYKNLIT